MATVNPVIRRGSTQDRNRQENRMAIRKLMTIRSPGRAEPEI